MHHKLNYMNMDWKDQLSVMFAQVEKTEDKEQQEEEITTTTEPKKSEVKKPIIRIELDKRRGKEATILSAQGGGEIPNSQELAKTLKKHLAIGGSERNGEILLQGDVRKRCANILQQQGYKTKVI